MNVALTDEQRDLLVMMLENALGELRTEVRHTHDTEFKQHLKHNEHLLREIITKLRLQVA